ncbi:MAG: hypothetical protein IMF05_08670 [Proteobacteria bacterium]|nr:hypothetical protein [Pseudomonadota bacterium]
MNSHEESSSTKATRKAARKTMERGKNVQKEVRNITLKALSEGDLDSERIKRVVRSVIEETGKAAEGEPDHGRAAMRETVAGLEEALAKAATASGLAIEEAAGRVEEFTEHDLKRGLEDLGSLEGLFLDILRDQASSATDLVKEVLHDAVTHGQRSGTSIGTEIDRAATRTQDAIGKSGRAASIAGAQTAKGIATQLARVASGILAGMADALQGTDKGDKRRSD